MEKGPRAALCFTRGETEAHTGARYYPRIHSRAGGHASVSPGAEAHRVSPLAAKLSRLSLALPPLTLTPFPGPGPRRPPWEGADAGAAGGEAGGAGSPGPAEEDGEDEDEDEEEEEEAVAAGAAAGPRGPGRARAAPVPVVVSSADADAARPLRGLLKSPRGADEPEDSELERKRKMVSFHGDVTVYLFDQVRCRGRGRGGEGPAGRGRSWGIRAGLGDLGCGGGVWGMGRGME